MKNLLRWKKVCVPFLILVSGTALAAGESAPQALASLPPLPKAATKDMDCSAGEKMRQKVEEVTQGMMTASQMSAAGTPTTSMTPAQMEALQSLTLPEFNQCPIDAMQPAAQGWSVEAENKLEKRLADINKAKMAYDQKWCETHSTGEMCDVNPESFKRFNAQAVTAATQFLADVQPGYAKLTKLVGDCIAMRDKPVVAARGVSGALGMLAVGADSQNWGLVGMVADAHGKACERARNAAATYAGQ